MTSGMLAACHVFNARWCLVSRCMRCNGATTGRPCSFMNHDYPSYLDLLFESADRYDVSVHAFVCVTNHVHILLTPWGEGTASLLMQRLGALHTSGIHSVYHRTGSHWEERFKSSLVDSERYVLSCFRYIELNPLQAGMGAHPADYRWSSYRHPAESSGDCPIRPHSDKREIETVLARRTGDGQRGRPGRTPRRNGALLRCTVGPRPLTGEARRCPAARISRRCRGPAPGPPPCRHSPRIRIPGPWHPFLHSHRA